VYGRRAPYVRSGVGRRHRWVDADASDDYAFGEGKRRRLGPIAGTVRLGDRAKEFFKVMEKSMSKRETGSGIGETIRTIVYAVLIALALRTFAYEPFSIPSGSMLPTLLVGDYLFVSKFSYGYSHYSLPWSLPLFSGRILAQPVQRGDVVVFKLPTNTDIDYIKRIIGLPGDRIQVKNGILNINGKPVERRRVGQQVVAGYAGFPVTVTEYIETLPNGRKHQIWERSDNEPLDNTPVYTVPKGHYFAMGDNRDSSQDSRVMSKVGFIPAENLIGRAEIVFFSHNAKASFWEVWKWPEAIRFGRFLHIIH
jgi:signal peptidase I